MIRPVAIARYLIAFAGGLLDELDRASDRWLCGKIGHDPSWLAAVRVGITDRPICARCKGECVR